MGSWKIGNVKVEEIPDVDPEVYRSRAKSALYEGRYKEALQDAKKALKYGNNDIQDHILMVKTLCRMQEYGQCLEYIRQNKMVDSFFTEEYREKCFSPSISSFFESYLECWKHVGGSIDETDVIIVIEDGTGMMKSLQDAIDMECKCHRIYFQNKGKNREAGIIDGKDLSLIIQDRDIGRMKTEKYSPIITINSGNVHFINSVFGLTEYTVGVEINGGNVLFEHVQFSDSIVKSGYTAIGVYVKNQATVSMKHCEDYFLGKKKDEIIALYAECGNIDIRDSQLKYIVVIGKKGKSSLNLLRCRENYGNSNRESSVLVGYNTETQINNCECSFITLEGKMQMDCQDNLVMNVFDTKVIYGVAAYNGGIIYLHNSGSADCDLEADNGKIFCENFKSEGSTVRLRQGMGKNTEIICDCGYKVVNNLRNEVRMGAFLNKIGWLMRSE